MFGKECTLCGGKLKDNICTECGLDNSKNDSRYEGILNRSNCDGEPLTHVHRKAPPEEQEKLKINLPKFQRPQKTQNYSFSEQSDRKRRSSGPGRRVVIVLILIIVLIFVLGRIVPIVLTNAVRGVSSLFSSDTVTADQDSTYDYVAYELAEDGDNWNEWIYSGEYIVGVHIPEGSYTVKIQEGEGTFQVDDGENSIYLWEEFASEGMGSENAITELQDVRLYNGAIVRVEGASGLDFTTENAQPIENYMENPLTEEAVLDAGRTWTAGVDFPEGVYDVIGPESFWGYLEIEVPIPEGEEYAPYYISNVWLDDTASGEVRFKNLVLPAGVVISLEDYGEGMQVTLRPSEIIESTDYEGYYLRY